MPILPEDQIRESLGGGLSLWVSSRHTFGADPFLLASFAKAGSSSLTADLGAGCGIVSFLIYKMYQTKRIYGLEISSEGAALFRKSVADNDLTQVIHPLEGDLRQIPGEMPLRRFDLVVCNPPYFRGNPSPDPVRAAAREEQLCSLEDVCAAAEQLLRFGGRLCVCQRPERLPELFAAMRAHRIEPKRLRLAADTLSAPPWLALVEGRLGGKPSLQVEPLFCAREADGCLTKEMAALYCSNTPKARKL